MNNTTFPTFSWKKEKIKRVYKNVDGLPFKIGDTVIVSPEFGENDFEYDEELEKFKGMIGKVEYFMFSDIYTEDHRARIILRNGKKKTIRLGDLKKVQTPLVRWVN